MTQGWLRAALPALAAALIGCATATQRIDQQAGALGLQREVVAGDPYRHLLYFKPGAGHSSPLHVYIEHDGSPWLDRTRVSADPTPRNPLMLELMGLDPGPALYLGRPCYFELEIDPPCSPLTWTHHRYAEEIVASMAAALRAFLARHHGYNRLALFGHSGGGTLAVLLAERLPQTVAVVTLAGNLDIERWVDLHHYSRLDGSINPASRPPLREGLAQLHYVGGRDTQVPPEIARSYAANRAGTEVVEIAHFDHTCCWQQLWPAVLAEVDRRAPLH